MNKFLVAISVLVVSVFSHAKQDVYTSFASDEAIKGYDPVAYFTQNEAVQGSDDFSFNWMDVTWLFASKQNLDLFKSNPEKYSPQFGGYCAFAMASGKKVKINPKNFSIIDDKLYLNYNSKVQQNWLKDSEALIKRANDVWVDFAEY
ncbi:YHS domain-containing (seleno)protein [Marinicellulosiphila megalodicopiae]|uniref:YHS domain-containing (seleno)protein n=1 Tax=Marinicellulosiphila megalodicopiae TaxID=2724896 RepID=UPI003BB1423F